MVWFVGIHSSALAASPHGGPDVVVTSDCAVEQAGFVDVDADGVDDLTLQIGESIYAWPSGHDPQRWVVPGAQPEDGVYATMTSGPNGSPAQLHWAHRRWVEVPEGIEYAIDPATLSITETWSDDLVSAQYIGDIDGDGTADVEVYPTYRLSSTGEWLNHPPMWMDARGYRYFATGFNGVGDVNADGFDDVLVAWGAWEFFPSVSDLCSFDWGPAELFLGSPTGLQTDSLWRLWAPGQPDLRVGGQVVSIPERDILIVSARTESFFCCNWTPTSLAVIRGASTPDATMDPLIATPDFGTDECLYNDVFGLLPGPGGPTDLAILDETDDTQGIHWFSWDMEASTLSATALTEWTSDGPFELYPSFLSIPVGRRSQALVRARVVPEPDQPNELLIWGRTLEDVGPTQTGSTVGDCTFWAAEPPQITESPNTTGTPGRVDPDGVASPFGAVHGCGCATSPTPSIGAFVVLVLTALRRRQAYAATP